MRDIFVLDPDKFYPLLYTNQYFFTFYIVVQNFMTNIYTDDRKNISMMMGVVFFQNRRIESFIIIKKSGDIWK